MTNALEAQPAWLRLNSADLTEFERQLRAKPVDRAAAIQRFAGERTNAVKLLGEDVVGLIDQYMRARGSDVTDLRPQLIDRLSDLELERWTDAIQLIHMHTLCCHFGLICLGRIFREKARTLIVQVYRGSRKSRRDPALLRLVIAGAFERGNMKLVRAAARDLVRVDPEHPVLVALQRIGATDVKTPPEPASEENERFAAFVKGREVVVAGPAAITSEEATPRLNASQVVVTMNAKSATPKDYVPQGVGHVSYYNSEQARYILAEGMTAPDYLDWCVLKRRSESDAFRALNPHAKLEPRMLRTGTPLMFNGIPNALQNVLFDLATFEPASIHVCLCDFMLSSSREKGYYPPEWKRDTDAKIRAAVRRTFALMHDPISQFLFTKSLMAFKGVGADKRLSEILPFNEHKFSLALERVYRVRR